MQIVKKQQEISLLFFAKLTRTKIHKIHKLFTKTFKMNQPFLKKKTSKHFSIINDTQLTSEINVYN